ncbi:uncharacterized protein LOC134288065 [Aedes albopictus]|uniref:Peptidase A2 domain-containing protein n=1 Tax=Aedes albopictus TaxID=7160 RepID=A0ABM1ZX38_AEDAL
MIMIFTSTRVASTAPEEPVSTACSGIDRRAKHVFLMTALVNVASKSGKSFKLRALLDSGSQVNLVSEAAVKLLGLPRYPANVPVVGVGGARSQIRHHVILKLSSDYTNFESDLDCLVTARVTGRIPSVPVNISDWKFLAEIVLADPSFNQPRDVDLLIGAEHFFEILKQAQMKLSAELPALHETQFGWVVAGAMEDSGDEVVNVLYATNEDPLLKSIQRFFEQEELPEEKVQTSEEEAIEEHFSKTYRREEDGRFVVQLPFRESINQLGDSRSLAMKRFLASEKRLANQPEMKEMYQAFIREYEGLGHCHEIREVDDPPNQQNYYFPHHAVLKPSSTSTKLRVVFDGKLGEEIECVQRMEMPKRLANLHPFLDEEGFLRVGGRLQNSMLPFDAKHQLLLPRNHRVAEMLIRQYHEDRLHEGPSGLLAAIRQKYWLVNARSAIRKVTRSCVKCFRTKPREVQPEMGNLPEERVNLAAAFELTGVDYAGPVTVKEGRYKPKHIKAYIALFVCLTTKSIHLELVSDLTTEAFLAALDRFVNRRGMVRKMMSDDATNFVGASRELHQLHMMFRDQTESAKINDFLLKREWEFIPPRSPNFGGLWEAGVKVVKSHLHRTLGNAILNFEEFGTVLTSIEAMVNSRPLYALSDDPNEPLPITPAHLMLGRPLEPVVKPSYTGIPLNRLSRFQYMNHLREQFWAKWSRDYLSSLQSRAKWTESEPNVKLGTIVLMMEENQAVQSWRLGRIAALHPGQDGVVRVADVKTAAGIFRRSIRKLAPLPIEDTDEPTFGMIFQPAGACTRLTRASENVTSPISPSI